VVQVQFGRIMKSVCFSSEKIAINNFVATLLAVKMLKVRR